MYMVLKFTLPQRFLFALLCCSLFGFLSSCTMKESSEEEAYDETFAEDLESVPDISDDEVLQFAQSMEAAVAKKDFDYIDKQINYPKLAREIMDGMTLRKSTSLNKGFITGLRQAKLGDSFTSEFDQESSFSFLKQYKEGGIQHIVFRVSTSAGLNYIDFYLTADEFGNISIYDMFLYTTGEKVSETMRVIVSVIMRQDPSMMSGIDIDRKKLSQLEKLLSIKEVYENGDPETAYQQIQTYLRQTGDSSKIALLYKLFISGDLDDETMVEYKKSIDDYTRKFPEAKNVGLMLMDGYLISEEYDLALENVNLLDEGLGGDPYLDFIRGNIYLMKNDAERALGLYEKSFEYARKESGFYVNRTFAYAYKGEYDKAVEDLTTLSEEFDFAKLTLELAMEEDEGMEDFINSPEYAAWIDAD